MEKHDRYKSPDRPPATARRHLLLGLWIRAACAGVALVAAGFASLIDPTRGMPFVMALTSIVAGGTFAWLARQRTNTLVDGIDTDESVRSERNEALPGRKATRISAAS